MTEKEQALQKALRDGGFYGSKGVWNAIIKLPGDDHIYRKRVETIIVRNEKEIFLKKKPDGSYYLPGGSSEKDLDDIEQAVNECREEARINVKNIFDTNLTYKELHKPKSYYNDLLITWDGNYTKIFVAEYDSKDKEFVDKIDRDSFIESGRFYPIKNCWSLLSQPHVKAVKMYLDRIYDKDNNNEEEVVQESYIFNFFKNKKLLKDLSNKNDFTGKEIDGMIEKIDKVYGDLKNKSRVKRIIGTKECEEHIFPVLVFTFDKEGKSITIAVSYYDTPDEEACAFTSPDLGDVVLLYPMYFRRKKEVKKFILLHEIGHIRLGHTKEKNMHKNIFGEIDEDSRREKVAGKGKTVYPELNADLYAVLHGAKMYAILSVSHQNDIDANYDYRISNSELANRYLNVFSMYKKYNKQKNFAYEFTDFDMTLLAIHDLIYENDNLTNFSKGEKEVLEKVLYDKCISSVVGKNKRISLMTEKAKEDNNIDEYNKSIEEQYFYDRRIFNESVNWEDDKSKDMFENFIMRRNKAKEYLNENVESTLLSIKEKLLTESSNLTLDKYRVILEAATKRKNLPNNKFGIPELRKYPLDTRDHVISAIKLFGHYADSKYAEELAGHILSAMKKYKISTDQIGEKNKLRTYLNNN